MTCVHGLGLGTSNYRFLDVINDIFSYVIFHYENVVTVIIEYIFVLIKCGSFLMSTRTFKHCGHFHKVSLFSCSLQPSIRVKIPNFGFEDNSQQERHSGSQKLQGLGPLIKAPQLNVDVKLHKSHNSEKNHLMVHNCGKF